jgi:hypothetical protein
MQSQRLGRCGAITVRAVECPHNQFTTVHVDRVMVTDFMGERSLLEIEDSCGKVMEGQFRPLP